jgi:transposase-like protein
MGNNLRGKSEKEKFAFVKSCIESGMIKKVYCKEHGVSSATFYNWHKRYRETELNIDEKFIPVVITSPAKQPEQTIAKNIEIEISYPNGVRVKLNQEMDLPMLRSLISLL